MDAWRRPSSTHLSQTHLYHQFSCYFSLSWSLKHTSPLLLYALKLIVMLCVVCQSWWWICLWVERADFPWVVSPSLSFYLFLLYFLYSICPSNQRGSLSALATPSSTVRSCRVLLLAWCPSLISSSSELRGSLTSWRLKYASRHKFDFYFGEYLVQPHHFKVFNHAAVVLILHPHLPLGCRLHANTNNKRQPQSKRHKFNKKNPKVPESSHAWVMFFCSVMASLKM